MAMLELVWKIIGRLTRLFPLKSLMSSQIKCRDFKFSLICKNYIQLIYFFSLIYKFFPFSLPLRRHILLCLVYRFVFFWMNSELSEHEILELGAWMSMSISVSFEKERRVVYKKTNSDIRLVVFRNLFRIDDMILNKERL